MEENTRVTVRLPSEMVNRLQELIDGGKYDNLSEAIRDCIQEYLDSNSGVFDSLKKKDKPLDLETISENDGMSMSDLIREAAKKYTKEHLQN